MGIGGQASYIYGRKSRGGIEKPLDSIKPFPRQGVLFGHKLKLKILILLASNHIT